MRQDFVETLVELGRADGRILLLTADLGWSVLEPFRDAFPDRFLNVGVAEQNLAGLATGLALAGFVPFIYSMATFVTMRCYEQLRNGPALHRLPVRVVGVGGGYSYGQAGPTHHALEDLGLLRLQPDFTVLAPADGPQTRAVLLATLDVPGPVYLRLDKNPQPPLPGLQGRFSLGRPELIRPGQDVLLLTTGSISHVVLEAAELLEARQVSAGVAVLAHLGRSAEVSLRRLLRRYRAVVTVEEGFTTGGLGSLAAETSAAAGLPCRLKMLGVEHLGGARLGGTEYLRRQAFLSAEHLAEEANALVRQTARRRRRSVERKG